LNITFIVQYDSDTILYVCVAGETKDVEINCDRQQYFQESL